MAELITERAEELAGLSMFADCFGADLYGLATELEPIELARGEVLMQQGDEPDFFVILAEGSVEIRRDGPEHDPIEISVAAGQIIGEIALLRNSPRIATVVATAPVRGWRGDLDAFHELIGLPGVLPLLVRTARQRLAAFITPIPIRLPGGSEFLLRPVLPGDNERTSQGHVEFSADTFYRRFMSARAPSKALMDYLFEVDYVDHFVWVITNDQEDVLADARYVREEANPGTAEIAFIVGDEYQGKGLGSFLMKALVLAAHVGGVEKFTARVLSENMPMRKILDTFGVTWEREDLGVVNTVFEVPDARRIKLPKELAEQITSVARQVIGAVG